MITLKEVEAIHQVLIEKFGGAAGIRDLNGLESALARPFQQFDGNDLYPTILLKSAALVQSILINHPFVDGNKRTGYTLLRYFLLSNHFDIEASQEEKYEFIIAIASGNMDFDTIAAWLDTHTKKSV